MHTLEFMFYALMIGTGIVVTSAMTCTAYLYRYRLRDLEARRPVLSIAIIASTAVITGLQFVFPEILFEFRRNWDGLLAGEWWRIATPLFVQPSGWSQCLFNGVFAVVFLPVAERLYARGLLALYFVPGVLCQAINYAWSPDGGGSSTGVFGVMGGLLVYILHNRQALPLRYVLLAISGLCAAGVLSVVKDGHGPALLAGALLASLLAFRRLPASVPPETLTSRRAIAT